MYTNQERKSTVVGKLDIIEHFKMPQFDDERTRTIRVWMPKSYDDNSNKFYPVIYMHDGQNLFDNKTSFLVEWEIDESITRLIDENTFDGAIVVGIDNSNRRINEYIPKSVTYEEKLYEAEGELYGRFLVETLKPYIDSHYRTKKECKDTMIVGSSLGGVISFYIGLKYPEVFSKIGALSTAFHFFESPERELFYKSLNFEKLSNTKLYLDASTREDLWIYVEQVKNELKHRVLKPENIYTLVNGYHNHDEIAWRERFPLMLLWLYEVDGS